MSDEYFTIEDVDGSCIHDSSSMIDKNVYGAVSLSNGVPVGWYYNKTYYVTPLFYLFYNGMNYIIGEENEQI